MRYAKEIAVNPSPHPKQFAHQPDVDPAETEDWVSAFDSVVRSDGKDRARFLLASLDRHARDRGVVEDIPPYSPYRNSIEV